MSISIIHLTDIHMVTDVDKNIVLSRKQQLYDAIYSTMSSNDSAIIVISGDVAQSGKKEEYANAIAFIEFLRTKLSEYLNSAPQILIIPGNHDCNFEESTSPRERLLSTFDASLNIDDDTFQLVTTVQKEFFEFSNSFFMYNSSNLCDKFEVHCGANKILFQLVNSAWMSQIDEQPGKLIIPNNALGSISADEYDCVFTVMHHPYNWLHPDNCSDFLHFVRNTTDVLIIGHEHHKDSFITKNEMWMIHEFRGKELQNSKDMSSAFSIYQFDEVFQNLVTYDFSWNGKVYSTDSQTNIMFSRNTLLSSFLLMPSKEYINEYIDDLGMIVVHENTDIVKLPEIFCWPDIEQVEFDDSATITLNKRINADISTVLLSNSMSILIGDSLTGKTSIAKMLFRDYSQNEKCCVLLEGKNLNTIVEKNLKKCVESAFISEYSENSLEKFRHLPPEKRIIIIDDFGSIPYHDERRSKVLTFLSNFASCIIVLMENEMEAIIVCSKLDSAISTGVKYYKICNFGNKKRTEFIRNWYCIRDEYANGNPAIEEKIDNSIERINLILGKSNGFIPAIPIYLINLLQNIDSAVPASFSGSQYGFLYESLISKSLSAIKYQSAGAFNIDINIIASLAFNMLQIKSNVFSYAELLEIINAFQNQKKVSVNIDTLMNNMLVSRLVQEVGPNTYKFRYPYIFYYFAGRYIAYNLTNSDVRKQIEYMSQRLYNEKYGNIIIFVCHFANNIEIIDDILLVAYVSLENYVTFDFAKHNEIFERAKSIIDDILTIGEVGKESDVEQNRQNELVIKDELGVQDGSVSDPLDISDDIDESEKDMASLSASFRIIDVLGQIVMNYPGDIDGDVKISIIDEIHKLGMRITEAMLSIIGIIEREFIEYIVKYVKDKKHIRDTHEVIQASRALFSCLVAGMTCGMIRKVSSSINNDALLVAVRETFANSKSISQKLVLADLQFNVLRKPNIHEALQLADELDRSSSTQFAGAVLRSIVSDYLRHNRCGHDLRSQLCNRFRLSDRTLLVEEKKNSHIS